MNGAILIISPFEDDHVLLRSILSRCNLSLHSATGRREAMALLCEIRASVIVCERNLIDGDWKDVVNDPVRLASGAPVVVISQYADEDLWLSAVDSGGHDVLVKPFDPAEVTRVVGLAWRSSRETDARRAEILIHS